MLADELDHYKEKGNEYVDNNIKEIQEIYMKKEKRKDKGTIENKEVILVRPYKVSSTTTSFSTTSFITDKVENLVKYMKFMKTPSQTRIFWPPPYYQSLRSRGEQDPDFWKEVAMAFVDRKKNTDTSRNGCQIPMYQGGLPHEPYFIAIDNKDQVIIGPSKKIVATHVVGELEVLVWFMRTWILKWRYCYNRCLLETAWTWLKGMTIWSAVPYVVSVSASYSRCYYLVLFLWSLHVLIPVYVLLLYIKLV